MSLKFDRRELFELDDCEIMLLGTLKGLLSEKEVVRDAFNDFRPDVIGLHIGKEEIKGLKAVVDGKVENTYLSSTEKIYARELSKYGEVQIPPPSLVEACLISNETGVPVKPLDFDETGFSEAYTDIIGGMTLIRQSLRLKNINRRKFRSKDAEDFVLEWDSVINRFKGFKRLEISREEKISKRIRQISRSYSRVLAVVEYERMQGILSRLRE